MRRAAHARLAGATFLPYIAASLPAMVLHDRATRGEDIPGTLASIARHAAVAWLFVRGRLVPAPLAWWGLGLLTTAAMLAWWIPMGLFELVLGPWLLIKGVPAGSGDAG